MGKLAIFVYNKYMDVIKKKDIQHSQVSSQEEFPPGIGSKDSE